MNTTTNNGSRNETKSPFRKLAFLKDEVVWQLALVGVVFTTIVERVLSLGSGTIV